MKNIKLWNGSKIPPLGMGTWTIGGQFWAGEQPLGWGEVDDRESIAAIRKAVDLGIRYFDTAPGYGMAEDLMIEWLKTINDPAVEVATKWGYTYTANFDPNATQHEVKEHSLKKLIEQWEFSKKLTHCNNCCFNRLVVI